MTGTAQDAARGAARVLRPRVVVIPTHRPMIRVDRADVVFTHREAKEAAVVDEMRRVHATGRPVLVGHAERRGVGAAGRAAARGGVACEVLNARNDDEEARDRRRRRARWARSRSPPTWPGRGTDIRLGGADESGRATRWSASAGLYVIGTNRHESRRVDLQLRGRAGRQGDPGESRFFVSLEDDLLVRYGIGRADPGALVRPPKQDAPDRQRRCVRREIARAQRIIEGQNFEIRRTLWRYASADRGAAAARHGAAAGAPARRRGAGHLARGRRALRRRSWPRWARRPSARPSGR